jgi:hypothetical protein
MDDRTAGMHDREDGRAEEREELQEGPWEGFLRRGERMSVSSSNVRAASYDARSQTLTVEYLDGRAYRYGDVSEDEALSFATTPSKGTYVWDYLRVRGSKTAHRKPVVQV